MTPHQETVEIIQTVCRERMVSANCVYNTKDRRRFVVAARHAAILRLVKIKPHFTPSMVARAFGMDHTSVLYVLGRLSKRRSRYAEAENSEPKAGNLAGP